MKKILNLINGQYSSTFYFFYIIIFLSTLMCIVFPCKASEVLIAEYSKSFNNIEDLTLKKMCGQDFWLMLATLPEDKITGLENWTFLRHAGYSVFSIEDIDGKRQNVTGGKLPVILRFNYKNSKIEQMKSETTQKWLKEYGDAFIGVVNLEGRIGTRGNWNVVKASRFNKQCLEEMKLPFPSDKEESYHIVESYFKKNLLLNDIKVPVLPGSIGFLDHHILRWGANGTTTYFGSNLLYGQLQSAFARGAVRQWGKYWNAYYATSLLGLYIDIKEDGIKGNIDGEVNFSYRSSEITKVQSSKNIYTGAHCGADVKTTMRPNYYYSYISGANSLQNECDFSYFRYAGYNPHSRSPEAPFIMNLREDKIYPSPVVDLYCEIDAYVQKQPRGIPYTPFAILLDRHHGYIMPYSKQYFTFAPLLAGDYQINALFDIIFPFEKSYRNLKLAQKAKYLREIPAEHSCFINLPYGNIFDVLTNDCSPEILSAYPVVLLTGLQGNWPDLANKLIDYVKNGGTLVMDVSQVYKEMPSKMTGMEITDELLNGCIHIDSASNMIEEKEYNYYKVKPINGKSVYKDITTQLPLLLRTEYGKGVVLLCTVPYYLDKRPNGEAKILKLYDIILCRMIDEVMPIHIKTLSGGADYSLNKVKDDWLITLINYDGITHNLGQPVILDKSQTAQISIEAEGKYTAIDTINGKEIKCEYEVGKTKLKLQVEPSDVKIIKLIEQRKKI